MPVSRRHFLAAAATLPVVLAAERGLHAAADGIRTATNALRPPARGTSASRCAMCGDPGHTMLDRRCPAAKRVL